MWKEQKWEKCMWPSQNKLNRLYRSTHHQKDIDLEEFLNEINSNPPLGPLTRDYHELDHFDRDPLPPNRLDVEMADRESEGGVFDNTLSYENESVVTRTNRKDVRTNSERVDEDKWIPPSGGPLSKRVKQHFSLKRKGIEKKKEYMKDDEGDVEDEEKGDEAPTGKFIVTQEKEGKMSRAIKLPTNLERNDETFVYYSNPIVRSPTLKLSEKQKTKINKKRSYGVAKLTFDGGIKEIKLNFDKLDDETQHIIIGLGMSDANFPKKANVVITLNIVYKDQYSLDPTTLIFKFDYTDKIHPSSKLFRKK